MKKVAIIGLGWLGMPLALALMGRGYDVVGSKTTPDGVEAARMSGIECYQLELTPELVCDPDDLESLLRVDALVVTLPARRTVEGSENYFNAVRMLVDSAMAFGVPRVIFTSSTSVYGETAGTLREESPLRPVSPSGRVLAELERWLHELPNTSVDILRLAGLVGVDRHPGRFRGQARCEGGAGGIWCTRRRHRRHPAVAEAAEGRSRVQPVRAASSGQTRILSGAGRAAALEPPQFADEAEQDERLVDGNRICNELGFEYQYPDPARMPVS